MCKVSILMPIYNAEKYLAEAIESITHQTFHNWELIIINDGSTDSSKTIIENYNDSRIKYIENQTNLGLIETLNKGIDLCKGDYIARMDADDISLPNRLAQQVDFLEKNNEYVLVGSNAIIIDHEGNITGKIINPTDNNLLQISLLFTCPFVHPSVMIRRKDLLDCRFDKRWIHVEDYELWTRLAKKGKIANLKEPLLKYRWHDHNISIKHSRVQEESKDQIVKLQLEKLGINASQEELNLHRLTFKLYSKGKKNATNSISITDTSIWFQHLISQNEKHGIYDKNDLCAFLWSRWIVLCITQKKKANAFFPKFIPFNLSIFYRTIKLALYLSTK